MELEGEVEIGGEESGLQSQVEMKNIDSRTEHEPKPTRKFSISINSQQERSGEKESDLKEGLLESELKTP